MTDFFLALVTVTLAWWLSTGIVLLLNRRGESLRRLSLIGISALALMALIYIPERTQDRTAFGALLGFGQGLVIWAWLEMTYLMGVITGPRKTPCPPDANAWRRFWLGLQTSLYHELSVITLTLSVIVMSSGGPNFVAAATLSSLWLMRWSAKLNLFLGVRNYNSEWFPEHLRYLDSYTRKASMNLLFPLTVTVGTAIAAMLLSLAVASDDPFAKASHLLVSALLSLAVLEHWFLMYPFGESALWRWALETPPSPDKPLATVHPLKVRERTS